MLPGSFLYEKESGYEVRYACVCVFYGNKCVYPPTWCGVWIIFLSYLRVVLGGYVHICVYTHNYHVRHIYTYTYKWLILDLGWLPSAAKLVGNFLIKYS